MRRYLTLCAAGLLLASWLMVGSIADQVAVAESGSAAVNPAAVRALAQVDRVGSPMVAVSLEDTRSRVAETETALQLAVLQKRNDDRHLRQATAGADELRDEAKAVAEDTVKSAISTYRNNELNSELEASVFELTDLNQGLRASALSNAALVADTEVFNQFHDKQRDFELAQVNLEARAAINQELGERVERLQADLDVEQAWLAQLEERNIQQLARQDSVKASTWAQNRGRKVGFFLLTCPVDGPHSFIDSWGFARSGGRRHKGVDILAKIGVPIVAPVNGRVEHRSNRVGGRSFHLRDDNGNYFYGTHLSGYGKSGEVKAGEIIGYVGDDGNAAGIPHLHFEIHAGGRGNQINPYVDSAAVCSGAR